MASSVEHLQSMRAQLNDIHEALPHLGVRAERLPIIDVLQSDSGSESDADGRGAADEDEDSDVSATGSGSGSGKSSPSFDGTSKERAVLWQPHTGIPGLRILRENIRNDIEQIDKFLTRHAQHRTTVTPSAFSTNAPYLVAVWNELVRAPQPIVAVDKTFSIPIPKDECGSETWTRPVSPSITFSRKGALGTKVDIVADNGRQWIRVNTIRNTRLLAELRELDSYLTDSPPVSLSSPASPDEDEDEDEIVLPSSTSSHTSSSRRTMSSLDELDNSLLRMGKELISAARSSALPSPSVSEPNKGGVTGGATGEGKGRGQEQIGTPPKVILRLTRLKLDSSSLSSLETLGLKVVDPRERSVTTDPKNIDTRIAQTLRALLDLGIEVILGEHEFTIPPSLRPPSSPTRSEPRLIPTRQVNLDLSVLIALISDITHAPLPTSSEEARRRYIPTAAERERSKKRRALQKEQKEALARARADSTGKSRNKGKAGKSEGKSEITTETDGDGEDEDSTLHSRALASQLQREVDLSLLDEIASRLSLSLPQSNNTLPVEFWTSREARDRCLRIVSKIGGPAERKRAAALFFDLSAPDACYAVLGVNYVSPHHAADAFWRDSRHPRDMIPGLVPLRVFEDEDIDISRSNKLPSTNTKGTTIPNINNTFWSKLEHACARLLSSGSTSHPRALPSTSEPDSEIPRASVTLANPRLTAHTVSTLYRGVARRWTSLTANRAGVREILKETFKAQFEDEESGGAARGRESLVEGIGSLSLDGAGDGKGKEGKVEETMDELAAIWIVEPRSLAESMRNDFVPA